MERVLEFVFTRFEIHGVSMQSADQGRCKCSRCATLGDAEYHANLLTRTAKEIRKPRSEFEQLPRSLQPSRRVEAIAACLKSVEQDASYE